MANNSFFESYLGFCSGAEGEKFVEVDKLSTCGKRLINFEPGEVVRLKGFKFKVRLVSLDPPVIVLEPSQPEESRDGGRSE